MSPAGMPRALLQAPSDPAASAASASVCHRLGRRRRRPAGTAHAGPRKPLPAASSTRRGLVRHDPGRVDSASAQSSAPGGSVGGRAMVAKTKKVAYFAHLEECLNKYQRACIVGADFVGSKQISDIRVALRGKAEMIFGKNTMIRKCIRNLTADGSHPEWESIIPVMKGNLGFVFTNDDLDDIIEVLKQFVKPAAAKAGVVAPCSCTINKGPTGLDPAQTSFFQALNIATKINKGSIEIINDCQVITEGSKVWGCAYMNSELYAPAVPRSYG
eukprot:2035221-Pleurochrysis_carterae.AAC.1